MATPTWQAATSGQPPLAAHVNQFLGGHSFDAVCLGVQKAAQTTAGTGAVNSNGSWIAQSFTTAAGQTQTGIVWLTLAVTGTPTPLTVSIYASSGGAPSGSPLVTTQVPREFVGSSAGLIPIPLPQYGLTASTTYWIVAQAVGDASDYFAWSKSNQISGASTSTNGASWTAQSYGLLYDVLDNAVGSRQITHVSESSGARWNWLLLDSTGRVSALWEYSAGPTPGGYLVSTRTFTYSSAASGILLGVS